MLKTVSSADKGKTDTIFSMVFFVALIGTTAQAAPFLGAA